MSVRPIDPVSRETVLEIVREHLRGVKPDGAYKKGFIKAMVIVKSTLKDKNQTPILDYAPVRHGEWLPTNDDNKKRCSRCDVIHLIAQYPHGQANYCPNCGAKMDGGKKDG